MKWYIFVTVARVRKNFKTYAGDYNINANNGVNRQDSMQLISYNITSVRLQVYFSEEYYRKTVFYLFYSYINVKVFFTLHALVST